MLRQPFGALVGLPLALGLLSGAAPPAKPDLGANAALKYWQAFAALPRRDKEQERLLQEWPTTALDGGARRLVDSARDTLFYLRRGGHLRACDWSLDYDRGPRLLGHHLNRGLTASRLAGLSARFKFQAGDKAGAVDQLADSLALARHLSSDGLLVTVIFARAIEGPAVEVLAAHLPEMDAPLLAKLAARLDALPPGGTLPEALLLEKQIVGSWFVRQARAIPEDDKGEWKEKVTTLVSAVTADRSPPKVREELRKLGDPTPAQLANRMAELGAYYDELAKLVVLPREQFEPKFAALNERTRAANPLADLFVPMQGLGGVYNKYTESRTRLELLRAAVAVARGGPDKVKDFRDPSGDGPFKYTALPGGFKVEAKRLALTVGPGKK